MFISAHISDIISRVYFIYYQVRKMSFTGKRQVDESPEFRYGIKRRKTIEDRELDDTVRTHRPRIMYVVTVNGVYFIFIIYLFIFIYF